MQHLHDEKAWARDAMHWWQRRLYQIRFCGAESTLTVTVCLDAIRFYRRWHRDLERAA